MKAMYYVIFALGYLVSLLPLSVLYLFSDALYFPLYYGIRYRRRIVRKNLMESFPEKPKEEIVCIEKQYYHFLCDCGVEIVKQFSMSKKQMKKRVIFDGLDEIVKEMESCNQNFCFVYLGHYGNWEWLASFPYWVPNQVHCAQIYHPLYNKVFDRLLLYLRNRFGGKCIPMKGTLRHVIELKQSKQKTIIGFIADQAPKWNSIHHWTHFFHRETPVFTGVERIGKQVNALVYYMNVKRIKRGYYYCTFKSLAENVKSVPDYELTDGYIRQLEQTITAAPPYWLWSHNRWKRTKEEFERRKQEEMDH